MRKHFLRCLLKLASSRVGQRSSIQSLMMNRLSPGLFLDAVNSYQRTAAIKAAIELDLFTAIGQGHETSQELALSCGASERGMRILSDYLVVMGFLRKKRGRYGLTIDSAMLLDRRSPAYLADAMEFFLSPMVTDGFRDVTAVVRKGGTLLPEAGTITPDHHVWVKFARAMAPMTAVPAKKMARLVDKRPEQKLKVLDVAASHGMYGIEIARRNKRAEVVAIDWECVLAVAKENALKAGIDNRYSTIPGSAFEVDYGRGYDLILLTNFLHHFDMTTCERLLEKVHAALAPHGRAVTVDFVPDAGRVSPPGPAAFCMTMLGTTPNGDAYTYDEFKRMLSNAGFVRSELRPLVSNFQQMIISYK